MQPENKLRLNLDNLPAREEDASKQIKKKHDNKNWGEVGDRCQRSCDCKFGLICEDGICTEEW